MNFRMIVKNFNTDMTYDSPIELEREEFQQYLSALMRDVENIDGVLSVMQNKSDIYITATDHVTEDLLKELIRPFLNQLNCNVKFESEYKEKPRPRT